MNNWPNHPTIFISHSSADIMLGRAARNILEDLEHHVILLGLLQNMTEYETFAFLDKEIKARDWLLLIDSQSAQVSKWVQFELAQAEKYGKVVYRINSKRYSDCGSDRYCLESMIRPCVASFSQSIRIFPSYSHRDQQQVKQVLDHLVTRGYQVWNPVEGLTVGSDWATEIDEQIRDASVILVFISSDFTGSSYAAHELSRGLSLNKPIVPIMLGSSQPPAGLEHIQYLRIDDLHDDSWRNALEQSLGKLRNQLIASSCE